MFFLFREDLNPLKSHVIKLSYPLKTFKTWKHIVLTKYIHNVLDTEFNEYGQGTKGR